MIKSSVPRSVKFSLNVSRGTVAQRRNLMSNVNQNFYNELISNVGNDSKMISSDSLSKVMSKSIPEHKKITLKKMEKSMAKTQDGYSDLLYDDDDKIIGQAIFLPFEHGSVKREVLPTIMHELTHAVDNLANPKYVARANKLEDKNLFTNKYDKLYQTVLYNKETFHNETEKKEAIDNVKGKVLNFLSGKNSSDRVDLVQNMRYYLESERNAYEEQLKYAKQMQKNSQKVLKEDLVDYNQIYLFQEKIDMLKEIGFDIIQSARKRFAKKFGS
jgi:hypothetical protein